MRNKPPGKDSPADSSDEGQPSDDELLLRAKAGDERALNLLIARLRHYVKKLALRRLPQRVRVRKDPSDLAQDTLAEGFRDFDRFEGASINELRAYLKRILERNAIDTLRAELDAFRRSLDAESSFDAPISGTKLRGQLPAEQTPADLRIERREQWELLLSLEEQLPESQRRALSLWRQRYPFREIAEILQVTEDAAKSLVRTAKQTLRECVPGAVLDEGEGDG